MKSRTHSIIGICILQSAFNLVALAQPTAFTYQGQLTDNGVPATGLFDLRFELSSSPSNSLVLGVTTNMATEVNDGLFTVMLDFGPGVFDGNERWLEIGARTNGGGAFSTLAPRQQIASTPYAIKATEAAGVSLGAITGEMLADGAVTSAKLAAGAVSQLGTPDGANPGAVILNDTGLMGVGTDSPQAGLHVAAAGSTWTPIQRAFAQDETAGYTNLHSAHFSAVSGELLVVGSSEGLTIATLSSSGIPILQSQIRILSGVYTNLFAIQDMALSGTLLAVISISYNIVILIDLTVPSAPNKVAELQVEAGARLALQGDLLAISRASGQSVALMDVSNPTSPVTRSLLVDNVGGFNQLDLLIDIELRDQLLAVCNSSTVTLIDVSNPDNPTKLSEIFRRTGDFAALLQMDGIALGGGLLAMVDQDTPALFLADVSNPTAPTFQASVPGSAYAAGLLDPLEAELAGNRLIISSPDGKTVSLFDVSRAASPRLVNRLQDEQLGLRLLDRPGRTSVFGDYLIVPSSGNSAFAVYRFGEFPSGIVTEGWMGVGTDAPLAPLHVRGNVLMESSRFEVDADFVEMGRGTSATGSQSVALGSRTVASGSAATALGQESVASGLFSVAGGYLAIAGGRSSLAVGEATEATGRSAVALGRGARATGDYAVAAGYASAASTNAAVAFGERTDATGRASTALGYFAAAEGDYTLAAGDRVEATGQAAMAFGETSQASGNYSVAGGIGSTATATAAVAIGNNASASGSSAVAMGASANASGVSAVALGNQTSAQGLAATALGNLSVASGNFSLAAGRRAKANHPGAFVWADSQNTDFSSATDDTFNVRASGGLHVSTNTSLFFGNALRQMLNLWADDYGIGVQGGTLYQRSNRRFSWFEGGTHSATEDDPGAGGTVRMTLDSSGLRVNGTLVSTSDRDAKEGFKPVDPQAVLEKVAALPLSEWTYKDDEAGTRHLGPMAQDFHAAFGVGTDDKHIATVDADGVALAAIQGLNSKLEKRLAQKETEIGELRTTVAELKELVTRLAAQQNGGAR